MPAAEPDRTEPDETSEAPQQDSSDAKGEAAPDEGAIARAVTDALRRAAPAITGIGVLLLCLELAIGAVPPPWRTALIIVGIALAAGSWLWDLLYPSDGKRRRMIAAIVGVSVFFLVLGYILRPVVHRMHQELLVDCADPVELTVLTPVDGAAGFGQAIAEFNRANVDGNRCRKANVTAYSAPWPQVEQAMEQGWESPGEGGEESGPFASLRDVGPRPHFWIAESQTQVDLAYEALDASELTYEVFQTDDAEPIGRTPLVLAVPDTVLEQGFNGGAQITDRSLPDLIAELGEGHDTPVLRSDPAVTTSGLLFLRALYGPDAEPGGVGARMENLLADAASATGIALSPSDTDLLCDLTLAQGVNPDAAVLTTEVALARYNEGHSLGDDCALTESGRSGLAPVYGGHFGSLDYQGVRLDWSGDPMDEERAAVAEDLQDWLAGGSDGWNPTQMGMRNEHYDGGAIEGGNQFDTAFEVEADPISSGEFTALRGVYGQNRPPTTVLLAIDHSATMDAPVSGGRTRFELATDGVATALQYLGANDEDQAALWTFPGPGSDSHGVVFGMTSDPGGDVAGMLAATETSAGVDLHQTVVDGVAELEAAGNAEGANAMVVLTDGDDPDTSSTTVEQVRAALAESQARLYLIAVGDVSCRSAAFTDLVVDSRVTCLEAEEERITVTFDSLFNQLWSGNA
ncbi:vWA domain-containing protein [Glycomyces sp. NPDC021274]|uniref:vWA domain-containing protein n=1 Tax=Glycomyces sp. NPDC021274 TaxID=3155120 RepID=UPI0033E00482